MEYHNIIFYKSNLLSKENIEFSFTKKNYLEQPIPPSYYINKHQYLNSQIFLLDCVCHG